MVLLSKQPCLLLGISVSFVDAWAVPRIQRVVGNSSPATTRAKNIRLGVSQDTWSAADDWSTLTSEHQENASPDTSTLFNQDLATNAAREIEAAGTATMTEEDIWISDVVDEIHNSFSTLDETPLYDSQFEDEDVDSTVMVHSMDEMAKEIAMLVRCNENPEELLISEGRALPPLSDEKRNDVSQLLVLTKDECMATEFLTESVSKMFHRHASPDKDGVKCLDRTGVAKWMTQSLKSEKEGHVSAHDFRVIKTVSDFSSYGSGRLLEQDFQDLYFSTIAGDLSNVASVSPTRHLQLRKPFTDSVWRDIRSHGILAPIEQERNRLAAEIQAKNGGGAKSAVTTTIAAETLMDECEILDWDYRPEQASIKSEADRREASRSRNSHKLVEMAPDKKTPLYMRDGEFVFIDEESCIGCMQCANVSPNSFLMLESGRARTFNQRKAPDAQQAVASCPVNCMHPVTYRELIEYETARDEGDGRTDHKHLGHQRGMTPLHVAGIDSDNNHRTSWYHTLKQKCVVSKQCPQKGCYNCGKYTKPGTNPYFQKRHREAEHTRAQYFIDNGDVDTWRKTADL